MPVKEVKPTLEGMRLPSSGATHASIKDSLHFLNDTLSEVVSKYGFFLTDETVEVKLVATEDDSKRGLVSTQAPIINREGKLTFGIDLTRSENFQKLVGRIPEDLLNPP